MVRCSLLRISLLAAMAGGLVAGVPASAQSFPALSGRVVDQANIIPPTEEAALTAQLADLEKSTGHQLVVATVNDLEGQDVSDYGYKLGRAWKIGDEARDDGVLFLIAPNERKMNISVGYGLEPILTDALSGRIIRNDVTPRFKAGDYPGGVQAGVNAIAQQIQLPPEEAALRAQQAAKADAERNDSAGAFGALFFWLFVFFFFILPMIRAFRGKKHRRRKSPWGAPIIIWGGGDDSWGSGGGSSWGSGGSSWGGGGFSGGGGSFGGGGASGGW